MGGLAGIAALLLAPRAEAVCSIGVEPVAFGEIDLDANNFSEGAVVVRCEQATSYSIALSLGGGGGPRALSGPSGEQIGYDLYQNSSYTMIWGDGVGWGAPLTGSHDGGVDVRHVIWGVAPPVTGSRSSGAYGDALVVTLTF